MNYRRLGRCGLKVSEIALGGWLTHGRTLPDELTAEIVRRAFDLGFNFFDTADIYAKGAAETALGKAIKGLRREDLVIATKCFFPMSEAPNDQGLSRKHIMESANGSLKRLGLEYVDLYQFHRFDPDTPVEESVAAANDLVRQGKALYWGVSEWTAEQIRQACEVARHLGALPPSSDQPVYSLLSRGIESGVIPCAAELGIGLVVFSPLAQGVLTGKYQPGHSPPQGSRGADEKSNMFMGNALQDQVLEMVQRFKARAESKGLTASQLALAWCLRKPEISAVIVGATSVAQLEENVGASGVSLSEEESAEIEAMFA